MLSSWGSSPGKHDPAVGRRGFEAPGLVRRRALLALYRREEHGHRQGQADQARLWPDCQSVILDTAIRCNYAPVDVKR